MPRKMKEPSDRDLSTLATFRITAGDWFDFGQLCDRFGSSASEALLIYIRNCLEREKLNLDSNLDSIDTNIDSDLADRMAKLEQRVANLEKKRDGYLLKAS